MNNKEHAQKIIDVLLSRPDWKTVPDWRVIDRHKKYYLEFSNEDIIMHYEIDVLLSPEIAAEGIAEGNIGPVWSHSKSVAEQERLILNTLNRKTRRLLKRELDKQEKKRAKIEKLPSSKS